MNASHASQQEIEGVLSNRGLQSLSKIADSLQGSIWRASTAFGDDVVVKVADRKLANESAVMFGGRKYKSLENILTETQIQKYVSSDRDCPRSIVKYIDSFATLSVYGAYPQSLCLYTLECMHSDTNYYLVMENGGTSLFQFVLRMHERITNGTLSICEWHKISKIILKQMVECIEHIHSLNVVHHDVCSHSLCIPPNIKCILLHSF